ncbi:cytochrome c [Yoonia sp.]|uniref:c-type cytochrome n=1 Tax=Yoonia sp. TaxID=2212373 RepID=UPI0019DEB69D|nr:cytochrome c [Yoonia sp.]MBE0414719.1 c-type cytochrome [Yoonia sp.]
MKQKILFSSAAIAISVTLFTGAASAQVSVEPQEHGPAQQEFVHGAPQLPSLEWILAAGGRIYDNWWEALDRDPPEGTNPAYPASAQQEGEATWRCKECHGWDYLGAEGIYRQGSHFTGIPGIMGARGYPAETIFRTLRDANHPYTQEMITDDEMLRVATFVSQGLTDMRAFINMETRRVIPGSGDFERGRAIFQTTCAACHGFDGRAMDWGEDDEHNFVGTEAAELPDEVYNKIANAHPGAAMINTRAFSVQDRISLMNYIATLPVSIDD